MGRVFTIPFTDIAVTAVQDFFGVGPATNKPCRLIGMYLSQRSDVGDAEEEILSVSVIRVSGTTVPGSGGAAVTPVPIDYLGTGLAAAFVARRNDTGVATGTLTVVMSYQFNTRAGLEVWFPPEARPQCILGDATTDPGMVVRLNVAPTDSLTMSGTLFVEEEG